MLVHRPCHADTDLLDLSFFEGVKCLILAVRKIVGLNEVDSFRLFHSNYSKSFAFALQQQSQCSGDFLFYDADLSEAQVYFEIF